MCGCLSHALCRGPGPQPRHVPRLGIIWRPFHSQAGTQSTEPHQPEPNSYVFKCLNEKDIFYIYPQFYNFQHFLPLHSLSFYLKSFSFSLKETFCSPSAGNKFSQETEIFCIFAVTFESYVIWILHSRLAFSITQKVT